MTSGLSVTVGNYKCHGVYKQSPYLRSGGIIQNQFTNCWSPPFRVVYAGLAKRAASSSYSGCPATLDFFSINFSQMNCLIISCIYRNRRISLTMPISFLASCLPMPTPHIFFSNLQMKGLPCILVMIRTVDLSQNPEPEVKAVANLRKHQEAHHGLPIFSRICSDIHILTSMQQSQILAKQCLKLDMCVGLHAFLMKLVLCNDATSILCVYICVQLYTIHT